MSSCVCKISFKLVQVCGGCCEMFRGLTFWDTVYSARPAPNSKPAASGLLLWAHAGMRYDTGCYFDLRSKAELYTQLRLTTADIVTVIYILSP